MSTILQKAGLYNQNLMSYLQKLGFFTFGDIYFVNPTTGDDTYDGLTYDRPFATLQAAYDATTTNQDDFIILSAYAAHAVTKMLSVTKNRIHFVSGAFRPGSIGIGARSRVTMGVTTLAADLGVMQNTGVGNTFSGIKFDSSNTKDESLYSIVEAGEYAIYEGCEFYKSTDLDETAAAIIANNGDSTQWISCTIGSSANMTADNKIRANVLCTAGIVSGGLCVDNVFDRCLFLSASAGTEHVSIYGANAQDIRRMLVVKDSVFVDNGSATPAHAVGFGAAQTAGKVILANCHYANFTASAEAAMGTFCTGAVPTFATSGVGVAS